MWMLAAEINHTENVEIWNEFRLKNVKAQMCCWKDWKLNGITARLKEEMIVIDFRQMKWIANEHFV